MQLSLVGSAILIASLLTIGFSGHAEAAGSHEYVIASDDGYGLEDCLAAGRECGQIVADAWCEAHGHGAAQSYGLSDRATPVSTASAPYVITCGD